MASLYRSRHTHPALAVCVVLIAAACSPADEQPDSAEAPSATAQPAPETTALDVRGPDTPGAPQLPPAPVTPAHSCTSSERSVALDEQTTLGASPSEMLQWLDGEHHEKLAWRDPSGEFVADAAASELEVLVEPPTAVHLIVSDSEDPAAGFCEQVIPTFGDIATTFDELRFAVRVHVSTSDGKLNLALDTILHSTASDYAAGWVELPLAGFPGRLPADARAVFLRLGFSPFGDGGQLIVSRGANDVSEYFTPAASVWARFPSDVDCAGGAVPFGAGDQPRGVAVAAALERLNALDPLTLNDSPATLSWTFSATQGRGCAELGTPARIASLVSFPARMSMRSRDGQIDGGSEVSVSLSARPGAMGMPRVDSAVVLSDMTTAAQAARDFGIQVPLDFSGFESALLSFSSERQGDGVVGSLSVTAIHPPSSGSGGATLYSVGWSRPLP